MSINKWNQIVKALKAQLSSAQFDAWVHPVHARYHNDKLHVIVPSRFFLDGLKQDCGELLTQLVYQQYGESTEIIYQIDASLVHQAEAPPKQDAALIKNTVDGNIDPRFTFKNFVVGSSNAFCFAASQAVAEKPGECYNPLYIHGGVGLGKTHLIHAIANELIIHSPLKIAYRTGERFTNELITAIRKGTTDQFRRKYRRVDVLIIDDVQFIAGKTSTQEEFFHTFNALHETRKQIILVSDRSPRDMSHLEERLRSRFNWGLVADIQPPDLETRLAILEAKAELAGIQLDKEVSYLLASRIVNNVRELEGALTRLTAFAHLTNQSIDIHMAKNILRDQLHVNVRSISVDDIQKKIAEYYGINPKDMRSNKRSRNIAFPRQVAMYASKELTQLSLPEIGSQFGGKDHTTILYAVRKINTMCENDKNFDDEVSRIISSIRN
ncbi:MAG: chromosomal replication initiator protein DnaA [Zetaproteobacteria bacterium CG02_land_8_20_14_3_00_50_9]|nr:MAG: chromosomal replication initiator protein DnaA [Zetaproteobacteria bacterium CG02_land_8_20_14_3_00_50_9]